MAPILYHVPKTISSPIVQCILELGLLDTHIHVQELTFVDLKTPAQLAINPMGTSPAFQDGNAITMWESGAILDYLLEVYDTQYILHPPPPLHRSSCSPIDRQRRANYLQLKQYIIATVYPFVASLYIHTQQPVQQQDQAYVSQATNKWNQVLGPTLTNWFNRNEGSFFMGTKLSALDYLIAKPLNNCHALGLLDTFPELLELYETIRAKPSFQRAYCGLASTPSIASTTTSKHCTRTTTSDQKSRTQRSILLVPNKQELKGS